MKVGTTDVSKRTLQAVQDGRLLFDLDQQPYLEGYYPVLIAAQYLKYGLKPITEIATGPLVITQGQREQGTGSTNRSVSRRDVNRSRST